MSEAAQNVQTAIMRNTMPMVGHWHAKRGVKAIDELMRPFVMTTEIMLASVTAIAKCMQSRFIYGAK